MQPIFLKAHLISPDTSRHYELLYNNFAKMIEIYFKNDVFWETDIFSLFFKNISICAKEYLDVYKRQSHSLGAVSPSGNRYMVRR